MNYYLYTDGGSRGNPGKSAIAYFLFRDNELVDFGGKYIGETTNNSAEYQALTLGLKSALKKGVKDLVCNLDSELVVKQLNKVYKISNSDIKVLSEKVLAEFKSFDSCTFHHIAREKNYLADKLVNIILDNVG